MLKLGEEGVEILFSKVVEGMATRCVMRQNGTDGNS